MSLLSICQHAANNVGIADVTTVFGNRLPAAQRLLEAARRTGRNISTRTNWVSMIVEHVFIANGTSLYTLPPDFRSMVGDTLWDRSRFWKMRGVMSPQQWQMYKSSIIGRATIERRWRLRVPSGNPAGATVQFQIDPDIGATNTTSQFVYEYVSLNWCRSATIQSVADAVIAAGGAGYAVGETITLAGGAFTAAAQVMVSAVSAGIVTDVEIVPTGGAYSVTATSLTQASTTGVGAGLILSPVWQGALQDDWRADTDTSIIDEDLIELGVIWRMLARLGMAYADERAEYESQVDQAVARDGGTSILNLAPTAGLSLIGPYNVQEGNFPGG